MSRPRFSIVTPVFDPPPEELLACLASVDAQVGPEFEHVVVDDASTRERVGGILAGAERSGRRTVLRRADNGGIVAATNDGIAAAVGEFVVLLDHDDVLADGALVALATAIDTAPDPSAVGMVYSDHDLLRADGRCSSPVYKPEFSLERLRNHNYITHLVAVRRDVLDSLGGMRAGLDGAQDHDLLLRIAELGVDVRHVPSVLAHWRQSRRSVAADPSNKPAAFDAGVRAVQQHHDRCAIDARVEPGSTPGTYRIRRAVRGAPTVSVVIPTAGTIGRVWGAKRLFVDAAVASLLASPPLACRLEFVVVLDEGSDPLVARRLRRRAGDRLRIVDYTGEFNFSDKINRGVEAARGEFVLLLNDDTELIEPGSVDEMVGLAQLDDVGMVGARLLHDDGTIQHAGHVYNRHIDHAFVGWPGDHPGPHRLLSIEREVAGVTAAAAMLRRAVFDEVGGMSTALPRNYNDVDLSLRVRATGRRIVWTPHATWFHFESRSRRDDAVTGEELATLVSTWGDELWADPYYNPNLADGRADWLERPGRAGAPPYEVLEDGRVSWA